jgi:hypothetical protein
MSNPQSKGELPCAECKNSFKKELLIACTIPSDDSVEYLCEACLDKSTWYCHHCGTFCAGIESYTFGPYAGFCDNCADQIEDSCRDYDQENEEYIEWPDYPPVN